MVNRGFSLCGSGFVLCGERSFVKPLTLKTHSQHSQTRHNSTEPVHSSQYIVEYLDKTM